MKTALLRCFHLVMVAIVLTGSTGFGLIEHTCQMRGKRISWVMAGDNCPGCTPAERQIKAQQQPTIAPTDCCKDESRYENVDVTSSLTQLVAKFLQNVSEALLAGFAAVLTWLTAGVMTLSAKAAAALPNAPPLPAGRDLLPFVQQFLI
jgi:hypothetical protein